MNWQLAAVYAIVAIAAVCFVRAVFSSRKRGCDCCEHRKDCPGCASTEKKDCGKCHKNNTRI